MLPVTVWMNYPSFYQGDLFRELIASGEVDLQVIFARNLTPDRLQLGWQDDLKGYTYRFIDKKNPLQSAVRLVWPQRNRLHIVNGLWAEPSFAAALVALTLAKCNYVIYSEAPDPTVQRSMAKRLLRSGFGRALATKVAGVLPISHLAFDFYSRLGVPENVMYPFGYFRSRARWTDRDLYLKKEDKIEIVFAGQVIARKGIDLLLEALHSLSEYHTDLILTIIGDGEMLPSLRRRVEELRLQEQVFFEGVIPPDKIPARLAVADLLVLPSRWDGWGLVINEAFSVGIPVIASDRCGGADLIQNGHNGYIFGSENVEELRACLSSFLSRRTDWADFRSKSAETGNMISTEEAAPYLINCLKHITGTLIERPVAPWQQTSVLQSVY